MPTVIAPNGAASRMGIYAVGPNLRVLSFCCGMVVDDSVGMMCYVCRGCGARFNYLSTKDGEVFTRRGAGVVRMAPILPLDSPVGLIKWWAEKWLRTPVTVKVVTD